MYSRKGWKRRFIGMPDSKRYFKAFNGSGLETQVELYYEHYIHNKTDPMYGINSDNYFREQMDDLMRRSRDMRLPTVNSFAHTEPPVTASMSHCFPPCIHAKEENPMRAYDTVTTNATTITLAPAASANIETKTDLQTQREFLLGRHNEVSRSINYGDLLRKMRDAFAIDYDNTPKTARELIAGIKSGKYTLDEKTQAVQDIEIADGDDWASPLRAMNWGGLQPDYAGFSAAQSKFHADLKAAKDTIMVGTPEAGLAAIQALEAWTPPSTAAAN